MRRHHQEAHVIGDLLIGEQRSVFLGRAAQLGEQIRRLPGAPPRDLPAEERNDRLAPLDALPHLRAGYGCAHHADDGSHHIDKRAVDRVRLRSELDAEEGGRGQIEGQLLDGRVELEIGACLPALEPARCHSAIRREMPSFSAPR